MYHLQSLCESLEYFMSVKLLTERHLEFLSLKGGCTGLFESIHVKIPHCWKSHANEQMNVTGSTCADPENSVRGDLFFSSTYLKFTEGLRVQLLPGGSLPVFLKKPIATCDFGLNIVISQIDTYKYNNYKYYK